MKDVNHIGSLKTVQSECHLSDGIYKIKIGPSPGNFNIQGRCGAFISAWAQVKIDNKLLLSKYLFEGDCLSIDLSPITTEIIINAITHKIKVEKISESQFYK